VKPERFYLVADSSNLTQIQIDSEAYVPHGSCQAAFGVGCAASLSRPLLWHASEQKIPFLNGRPEAAHTPLSGHAAWRAGVGGAFHLNPPWEQGSTTPTADPNGKLLGFYGGITNEREK